jgi:aspartyl-tRNA(Asn)/glutamyl-tRNA(Gln) amidotransferase subunit A
MAFPALKDLFETEAYANRRLNFLPITFQADAVVVQKLKEAGAVILGKLNMHEIALGVTNENPHFGDCCNPWDLSCITGGSSGGNAAALAAGFCMGALGSDTGGSIRIPSALCGVVGLKPTYGRVSLRGVIPLSWNLDHAGPMARNVRDAAILLQAIAGYDPQDAWSANVPVDDYINWKDDHLNGWRIALPWMIISPMQKSWMRKCWALTRQPGSLKAWGRAWSRYPSPMPARQPWLTA